MNLSQFIERLKNVYFRFTTILHLSKFSGRHAILGRHFETLLIKQMVESNNFLRFLGDRRSSLGSAG